MERTVPTGYNCLNNQTHVVAGVPVSVDNAHRTVGGGVIQDSMELLRLPILVKNMHVRTPLPSTIVHTGCIMLIQQVHRKVLAEMPLQLAVGGGDVVLQVALL